MAETQCFNILSNKYETEMNLREKKELQNPLVKFENNCPVSISFIANLVQDSKSLWKSTLKDKVK